MAPSVIPPLMSSDEVNLLVYTYLAESALEHSAFTLWSESRLGDFMSGSRRNSAGGDGESSSPTKEMAPTTPPAGHLIRILQKGLLYLQAEAKYRGLDVSANPPRLIGYEIPDALPIPTLPKTIPPPSPPPTSASSNGPLNGKPRRAPPTSSSSATSSNAVAGPSGVKRKEKDSAAKSDGATSQHAKKQKVVGQTSKSPSAEEAEDVAMESVISADTAAAVPSAPASKASKKGKGKAVDQHGDSKMTDASSSAAVTATPSKSDDTEQAAALQEAVSASAPVDTGAAASEAPSTTTATAIAATAGSAYTVRPSSSAGTSSKPLSSVLGNSSASKDATALPKGRRSTSPVVSRSTPSTVAGSAAKNLATEAGKGRPRSTSPVTTFRNSTSSSRAVSGSGPAQTPTLDASGMSSTVSISKADADAAGAPREAPRQTPKSTISSDAVIKLKGHTQPVQPCSWNPKVPGLLASGSGDSTARIWDVPASPNGKPVDPITCKHASGQRRSDVTTVEWNSEGTLLATGTEDGIARIWTPSGDLHLVLSMHQRTIFSLRWNSKGTMLLTGSLDHSICLWELTYGKVKQQWTSHSDTVLDLDWLSDDVFASCSIDKNIHIHQVGRPSPAYRFKGHSDEVNCIRFDPDKRMLASGSDDSSVRIWSLRPVKPLLGIHDADEGPEAGEIRTKKEDEDGEERLCLVLKGHTKEIHTVAWAPRSEVSGEPKLLASGSFDATVRLWDAFAGTCLHILNRHTDMVYSLAFQPDTGDYLASGSNDGSMCVTRIPKGKELVAAVSSGSSTTNAESFPIVSEYTQPGAVYEITWHPSRNQIAVCGKPELVSVVNVDSSLTVA